MKHIIFFHIPKAGGSTFNFILDRMYDENSIFRFYNPKTGSDWDEAAKSFIGLSNTDKSKISVLAGHMNFGLHNHFPSQEVKYITFFRDPIERIISHYNYVLRSKDHYLYEFVKSNDLTLNEYVGNNISWELNNGITRSLAGINSLEKYCPPEALEVAKKNIEKWFLTYGILEKFDESLVLFMLKLGWNNFPYYLKMNETATKRDISKEALNTIRKTNELDIELYHWAANKFDSEIRNENFSRELKQLHILNGIFEEGYMVGRKEGYNEGYSSGYNIGYNMVFDNYWFLKILRRIKKSLPHSR